MKKIISIIALMTFVAFEGGNKPILGLLSVPDTLALDTTYYQVTEKTERNTWDPVTQRHIPKYYVEYPAGEGGKTKRLPVPGGKSQWLRADQVMEVTREGRPVEIQLLQHEE